MFKKIYWLVPGRVLVIEFSGKTYLQELFAGIEQATYLMRKEGQPPAVHIILDSTSVTEFDPMIRNVRNLIPLARLVYKEPLLGVSVTLDTKPIEVVRFVSRIAAEMFKIHYQSTYSWDETLAYLAEHDPTLPENLITDYLPEP